MSFRGHEFRTLSGRETSHYQDSLSAVLFVKCDVCNMFDMTTAQISELYLPVALRTVFFFGLVMLPNASFCLSALREKLFTVTLCAPISHSRTNTHTNLSLCFVADGEGEAEEGEGNHVYLKCIMASHIVYLFFLDVLCHDPSHIRKKRFPIKFLLKK